MSPVPASAPRPVNALSSHPACFDAFTDIGSLLHLGLGWYAGRLPASDALALFSMFAGYQLTQSASGESWPRIGGELLEFGLGMLGARIFSNS